jgi:hypothetical protein
VLREKAVVFSSRKTIIKMAWLCHARVLGEAVRGCGAWCDNGWVSARGGGGCVGGSNSHSVSVDAAANVTERRQFTSLRLANNTAASHVLMLEVAGGTNHCSVRLAQSVGDAVGDWVGLAVGDAVGHGRNSSEMT